MLHRLIRAATAVVLGVAPVPVASQPVVPNPNVAPSGSTSEPTVPPHPVQLKLASLTPVELTMLEEVSSKTAVNGQPVRLALAAPLYVTGELGLPTGTPVEGIVIHAARGGMGGRSGELLIGARRILVNNTVNIPLRSFKLGPARGRNNESIAFATAVAIGLPSLLITGGSAKIPVGTVANAKTSADVELPADLLAKLPLLPSGPVASAQPLSSNIPTITQGE